jgi:phage shock protein PspC (stress-responsive transcriptional regulator)
MITTIILIALLLFAAHKLGIKTDTKNQVLGGVCAGIARHFKLAPNVVRALAVIFILVTDDLTIALYFLLWATLPSRR